MRLAIILTVLMTMPTYANEPESWLATYETGIDGGGTKTIVITRSADDIYQAKVVWSGRGTTSDVLICDVSFWESEPTIALIYNRFENPYMGTPGINLADPALRKYTDDGAEFVLGDVYMNLARKYRNGKEVYVPAPMGLGNVYRKKH